MPATSSPSTSTSTSPAAPAPLRTGFAIDVPATLLARARAGDRAAFEQLYRWFERPVFTLALRIGGDREEARDVLQETMLKVFRRIGEFRSRETLLFNGYAEQVAHLYAGMDLRVNY